MVLPVLPNKLGVEAAAGAAVVAPPPRFPKRPEDWGAPEAGVLVFAAPPKRPELAGAVVAGVEGACVAAVLAGVVVEGKLNIGLGASAPEVPVVAGVVLVVLGFVAPPNNPEVLDVEVFPNKPPVAAGFCPDSAGFVFPNSPPGWVPVEPNRPPAGFGASLSVGGGPAGVVVPKLNVFEGAGVVEPAGAEVEAALFFTPPNRPEPPVCPKRPPAVAGVLPLFSVVVAGVEAPPSVFAPKLNPDDPVADVLPPPKSPPGVPEEVVAGAFEPNKPPLGGVAVLVVPPNNGDAVPVAGLEPKSEEVCCAPEVGVAFPNRPPLDAPAEPNRPPDGAGVEVVDV